MGNSASSSRAHHDDQVDYGFLIPQGVYTGPRDWNQQVVSQFIIDRRLAPFYRPLEDYEENWDDEQILAARKESPDPDVALSESSSRAEAGFGAAGSASRSNSVHSAHAARRPAALKEPCRIPEAMVYRGAVECPICFLYYPPNINHSRCCAQAICTECFVQIKRSEPTTTHIVSEPAACPYCVQDNFGVTYTPPPWRAGIGAEGSHSPIHSSSSRTFQQTTDSNLSKSSGKRKSYSADSAEVVTIDQIRPDWEAKLTAVRAAVARRANRRIIMRQVGDRLIPVGVTSGRIHPLSGEVPIGSGEQGGETTNENEGRGGRRSRRRQHQQQPQDLNQLLGNMGLGGQDLEELMLMEAMRLSLLEHEEQQRKDAESKKKEEAEQAAKGNEASRRNANTGTEAGPSSSASRIELPPIPTTSPIDVAHKSMRSLVSSFRPPAERGALPTSSRSSPVSSSLNSSAYQAGSVKPSSLGTMPSGVAASPSLVTGHLGSRSPSHSRSGSATPSVRAATPNATPLSTLDAALPARAAASAVAIPNDAEAPVYGISREESASSNADDGIGSSTSSTTTNPPLSQEVTHMPPHEAPFLQVTTQTPTPTSGNATESSAVDAAANHSSTSVLSTSLSTGESLSYDELPSSPESTLSQRPLLLQTPAAERPDPVGGSESGPGVDERTSAQSE
ncbi:hypothetical protein DFH11DRAFT_1575320 [Phellopilus nigrolimitatus]|nr:hypothetical protein DFH11DRAFT_1575320 [Phellopilus nigrolimitatus]